MEKRHLEKEGSFDYDYSNDILFFKVNEREYSHSFELRDYVIDIDSEGYIVGVQIFNASKYFSMTKESLMAVKKWKLDASIENNYVEINLLFSSIVRNKIIEKNPILVQKVEENLPDSRMLSCVSC